MTSSGIIVIGRPQSKTIRAASGSCQMLNSADAVVFPSVIAPPMIRRLAIRSARCGCVRSSSAMFVSGPTAAIVTGRSGALERRAQQLDGALGADADRRLGQVGAVEAGPPWTSLATWSGRSSGPAAPGRDRDVGPAGQRQHAQRVVGGGRQRRVAGDGRDRSSSSSGRARPRISASASSCPGSQSRMNGIRSVIEASMPKSRPVR